MVDARVPPPFLLRAAWVAPMDGATYRDGGVCVQDGRIVAVGDYSRVRSNHAAAAVHDLGDVVLLPGLVNAHVHLELSDLTPGDRRPASFVDWLLDVMAKAPPPGDAGEPRAAAAARLGVEQCLRFGVTTVGDITRFPAATRRVLADGPLRAVSFGEVTAMGARRHLLEPRLAAALAPSPAPDRIVSAVSPHAPYSVEVGGYSRCVAAAVAAGVPVCTHLAETPDEVDFLTRHAGPFRRLWDAIGGWDDGVPKVRLPLDVGPAYLTLATGMLEAPRVVLAHVNYVTDRAIELLSLNAPFVSVVYCPRTHAYFGHPPHRWREMLARRVNVAVGTDSTASSPDLNLVDDLRLLHRLAPDVPPPDLWEMTTTRAARALGLADSVGSLTPGKSADLVAFPARTADPLAEVLEGDVRPTGVWVAGKPVGPSLG